MLEIDFNDLRYETGCYYTAEKNKLILLALLKSYGIKKAVVSPGATNFAVVGSMQHDPYFEMYSCVDERAASYMALGMSEKSGEPVVLCCTGATSSRNYLAALTEAYKLNLPLVVITCSLSLASVGHLKAQVTDRAHAPKDAVKKSFQIDNIKDDEDAWITTLHINEGLASLFAADRGPVHFNVCTGYSLDFTVKQLPNVKKIGYYENACALPSIPEGSVAIFIGSHKKFTSKETQAIDAFCEKYGAVVMCDHTSGYDGKYKVQMALPFCQNIRFSPFRNVDLLIHIGGISGDYYTFGGLKPREVWRVNVDGAYSDFFKRLTNVFKLSEQHFFDFYSAHSSINRDSQIEAYNAEYDRYYSEFPEIGFSNILIAKTLAPNLPYGSEIHFGILNSLRAWNFFKLPEGVTSQSNVGGFGIDGCVSSLVGAATTNPDKLYFGIVGDLTMFYDINVLLHRPFPSNVRLIVINNGRGTEFRNYTHPAMQALGISVDAFVAAAGHNGNQSESLLCGLCQTIDLNYKAVYNIAEFKDVISDFIEKKNTSHIIEAFTDSDVESNALERVMTYATPKELALYKKRRMIFNTKVFIKKLLS